LALILIEFAAIPVLSYANGAINNFMAEGGYQEDSRAASADISCIDVVFGERSRAPTTSLGSGASLRPPQSAAK